MQNHPQKSPHKNPRERLHKVIAASGYCSRRQAEILISSGQVKVNGKTVSTLGIKVLPKDQITINNQPLEKKVQITLALHKPAGILTSKSDPFHKTTVMDLLPKEYQHLNPIGRLDKDSEGLLLFTSDGSLLEQLTHPSFDHEKTYHVLVTGHPDENTLASIRKGGIPLDDYVLRPMGVKLLKENGANTWIEMKLKEGRKRQIRRVMDHFNHPVLKLIRVAVGSIELNDLPEGHWRELSAQEITDLKTKPRGN